MLKKREVKLEAPRPAHWARLRRYARIGLEYARVPEHPRLYTERHGWNDAELERFDRACAPITERSARVNALLLRHRLWRALPWWERVSFALFGIVPLRWLFLGKAWACSLPRTR